MQSSLPIIFFMTATASYLCQSATVFNKDKAIIHFGLDGEVFNDTSLDATNITKFVEVVAKRFRRIFISINQSDIGERQSFIPKAAAEYNLRNKNSDEKPVEIIIFRQSDNKTRPVLNYAIKLADEANSIFPETVTTIYLGFQNKKTCRSVNAIFKEDFRLLSETKYKIGFYAWFPKAQFIYDCMTGGGDEPNILSSIHSLYFANNVHSVGEELQILLYDFADTAKNFTMARNVAGGEPIEMVFRARVSNDMIPTDRDLVNLWRTVNKWTLESNNSYLFSEAFEQEYTSKGVGWWYRRDNHTYELVEKEADLDVNHSLNLPEDSVNKTKEHNYELVEKEADLDVSQSQNLPGNSVNKTKEQHNNKTKEIVHVSETSYGLITIIVLIIISLICLGGIFCWKKKKTSNEFPIAVHS